MAGRKAGRGHGPFQPLWPLSPTPLSPDLLPNNAVAAGETGSLMAFGEGAPDWAASQELASLPAAKKTQLTVRLRNFQANAGNLKKEFEKAKTSASVPGIGVSGVIYDEVAVWVVMGFANSQWFSANDFVRGWVSLFFCSLLWYFFNKKIHKNYTIAILEGLERTCAFQFFEPKKGMRLDFFSVESFSKKVTRCANGLMSSNFRVWKSS